MLSLYIIFEWLKTLAGNFANRQLPVLVKGTSFISFHQLSRSESQAEKICAVSGKSAPRDQITRVLYLVTRFNPVLEISDVECYHMG